MKKYAFQTFENLGCNHHLGLYQLWLLDFLKSAVFSKRRHHKFFGFLNPLCSVIHWNTSIRLQRKLHNNASKGNHCVSSR
jgi:hypothetical protein